ncbi:MAG: HAD-IA family hydrolase [Kiloniellales bacterium]
MSMPQPFPWKLVVFDCDGTLVDSQRGIVETMAAAFEAVGHEAPTAAAVRRVVGLSLETAATRLLLDGGADRRALAEDDVVERLAAFYRDHFHRLHAAPRPQEPLFPGVREALAALLELQVLLGIATGKGRRGLTAVLDRHDILQHFATLQTADGNPGKPNPEMLLRAMAEVGAEPEETVLVGDTSYDMEMATNAGVLALGVSWGYHAPEELHAAGAARVIDHFNDLVPTLGVIERIVT